MQARKRGLFNCFSISYSKDCELIVQFNVKFTVIRPAIVNGGSGIQSASDTKAVVTDNWCYLYICFDKFAGADYQDAFECSVKGLPEDIDITFLVVTASAYSYTFGTPTSVCRLKGKTLSCEGRLAFGEGANQGDFINIFIVRNK